MVVVVYILSLVLIGEYLLIAYGSRQHPNPFSSRSPALAGHHIPCTQKERRRTAHLSLSLFLPSCVPWIHKTGGPSSRKIRSLRHLLCSQSSMIGRRSLFLCPCCWLELRWYISPRVFGQKEGRVEGSGTQKRDGEVSAAAEGRAPQELASQNPPPFRHLCWGTRSQSTTCESSQTYYTNSLIKTHSQEDYFLWFGWFLFLSPFKVQFVLSLCRLIFQILLPTIVMLMLIGIRSRADTQIHPVQA